MSESPKKKKESGFRALLFFLITKWNALTWNVAYCFLLFQANSNKVTQLPESYVASDKHNVRLI